RRRAREASPRGRFDFMLFGRRGPEGARIRLERMLARKIAAIDRICGLSEIQKEKLDAGGREDIQRVFERIEEQGACLARVPDENAALDLNWLMPETSAIGRLSGRGLFGNDSVFAAALKATLTPDQATRYGERSAAARESTKTISGDNAG